MAIFIIDQFSLNTDLPLDIRYVPAAGRFDPDISVYKYPGMQVYDTTSESVWYCDNTLNWVEVGSGADTSINELYNLVIDLSTYITNNVDVSINNLYQITNQLDASIIRIDVSLNTYGALLEIHEASLGDLEARVSSLETSVGFLEGYQIIQDASIAANAADILQIEASIAGINLDIDQLEASIIRIDSEILQIESSIADINIYQGIQDASIAANEAAIQIIDGSITFLTQYNGIQDASIAANEAAIEIIDGSITFLTEYNVIQDASIAANEAAIEIIDGSITYLTDLTAIHEASIGQLESDVDDIEASLGDYVRKDGDTMSGPLTILGGGLQVGEIGTPLEVSIYSDLYVHNNAVIGGSLTVDGSLYVINVETIDVSAAFIHLNTGLTGTPPESLQSGIVIGRGDLEPYVFIFDESNQTFRIGIASETSTGYLDSSTQAVATREDTPEIDGIAVWNSTANRFDTYTSLTYNETDGLSLDTSLNLSALAGGTDLMLVVQPDGYVIAQAIPNADASIADLYTYIDGSLASRDSSIAYNTLQIAQLDASIIRIDGSINNIYIYQGIQDNSIALLTNRITVIDGSITYLTNIVNIHEASIGDLYNITDQLESSIIRIDSSVTDLYSVTDQLEASIIRIDASVTELYGLVGDTSVKGAINIGDGSAAVYAGLTEDGSLQFREFVGVGGAVVTQNGDLIEISIDASYGGEVNTASNVIGGDASIFLEKDGTDLVFRGIKSLDPSTLIITNDSSFVYIDLSIGDPLYEASIGGLTDVSLIYPLEDHQILEYDADSSTWTNTDNIWWDTSLGTTTDDLGGIPQGSDLSGLTLKEILYKILYEYQPPTLLVGTDPLYGTYEKGVLETQFASIDVSYYSTNANYPLALLNNVHITKTGVGSIYDASLGLVATAAGTYTDATGITNWGGTSRTITYNVTIDDDQADQSQPAVGLSRSFTFYYRQYWGMVAGNTNVGQVDSAMIKALDSSRLSGETDLVATFDNSTGGFVKYLFAYPDTVAAPDNFGLLSQILDQNDFDITASWDTENEDVSVGDTNVRYRFYLLKNKVDTEQFEVTFKF